MQPIEALALTQNVTDWLENSRQPRVLHVFESACNLINEDREVVSLVTPRIGNGPFHLVVEEEILFPRDLNVESQVCIHKDRLSVGELTIKTDHATRWNPCPNWDVLRAGQDQIRGRLKTFPLAHGEPNSSLDLSNHLLVRLASALAAAEVAGAARTASKLAGLGPGLTPAGDDFLVGAMYATWVAHPPEVAEALTREIANVSAMCTTSLSAAFLRCAARGEAGIVWQRLFDGLISDDPSQMGLAADNLLSVGASSGADGLAGFIMTLLER